MATTAYTDGACIGNPGAGGWAWVVPDGAFASGFEPHTTNQRMEVSAALEAVRAIQGPLLITSDSTYVVNCFRDRWWAGWIKRGWKNSKKEPVANRDLWEPLVELVNERGDVTFAWVKGHSGDRWNDVADRLATGAAQRRVGAAGERGACDVAADLPADEPNRRTAATRAGTGGPGGAARRPPGHLVVVTGLGGEALGYDDTARHDDVGRRLGEVLAASATLQPDLRVLTGMGLGAEQLGAAAAAAAGIPYVAVLAFPDPDARWPASSRRRYAELLAGADDVVTLDAGPPSTPRQAGAALRWRDVTMAGWADGAVVVVDGRDRRAESALADLQRALGDDQVWRLDA